MRTRIILLTIARLFVLFLSSCIIAAHAFGCPKIFTDWLSPAAGGCSTQAALMILTLALCGLFQNNK